MAKLDRWGASMEKVREKRTLSTYVEPRLADKVEAEAKKLRVSTSAVLRWALMERYGEDNDKEAK